MVMSIQKNSALLQLVMHTTSVTITDKISLALDTHTHIASKYMQYITQQNKNHLYKQQQIQAIYTIKSP